MSDQILIHEEDKILRLAINRPETKNALNLAMYDKLAQSISDAPSRGCRVVVLTGTEGCFTSGNDLVDFANSPEVTSRDNPVSRFIFALFNCPIPVVVAVQGVAVGIGTTLLLHCDFVYADRSAKFKLPFASLGLCPEFASSYTLSRVAGHVKAAEWLMLGEFFSAEEALDTGILNGIVENPVEHAISQAQKLAKQAPKALRNTKALMKSAEKQAMEGIILEEFQTFADSLKGPEFAEAVGAFFEKREPDFSSFE